MSKHLVTFLLKYLDEDEQAAKRVHQPYRLYVCDDGHIEEPMRVDDLYGERDGEYQQWSEGEDRLPNHHNSWLLMYDPARVLRSIPARRRIVEAYAETLRIQEGYSEIGSETATRETLHAVCLAYAADYADKPDYRDEWRP